MDAPVGCFEGERRGVGRCVFFHACVCTVCNNRRGVFVWVFEWQRSIKQTPEDHTYFLRALLGARMILCTLTV